ncbi:uncharacterized protein LOC143912818 [Arctopsyche grandis]|uniref:uncharacterized protein LOC143912818 n=1 Tax=Arctopsyche grandis TaxID=121162 RepID=UPI00406D9CC8
MQSSQMIETHSTAMHTETFSEVKTMSTVSVKKSHSLHRKKSKREEKNVSVKNSSEKVQKKLKNEGTKAIEVNSNCQSCGKAVYAMERIKAEKLSWHKECFRCKECNKLLSVETFQSHLSNVYCKPHFKLLFAPKVVEDDEQEKKRPKKHQMIICESNPQELPPDVIRASDKPDLGLEELASLDVKSRFQMFEQGPKEPELKPVEHHLSRDKSSTLLSKLAKFKSKGMDIGVSDDYLNGIPIEPSSSEEDDDDGDATLRKSYKQTAQREQPVSFCNMSEILGKFETGDVNGKERRDERKEEIRNIRNRMFMGKQAKIKEMYQQSVMQSEQTVTSAEKIAKEFQLDSEKASSLKERFENGEIYKEDDGQQKSKEIDDKTLFNSAISKNSRSLFQELDATNKHSGPLSPPPKNVEPRRKEKIFIPKDVVRAADRVDDVKIETSDISNKFKFFETYQPTAERKQFRMTPPRETNKRDSPEQEVYRDPTIVREEDTTFVDSNIAQQRHTASRMINVFKKMEEDLKKDAPQGPKPLKRFTPPPPGADYHAPSSSEEEYSDEEYSEEYSEEEEEDNVKRYSADDEALKQAQALAKAKNMKNRFENWSEHEPKLNQSPSVILEFQNMDGKDDSQIESAKSLRQKFESMRTNNISKTQSQTKVNRFV